MHDVFVKIESDIVQWAHAMAVTQGTSVSRLLSTLLRQHMPQGEGTKGVPISLADASKVLEQWPLASEDKGIKTWKNRILSDE